MNCTCRFLSFTMVDRTRCASIILIVLGVGFIIGGVLLFVFSDRIIASSVKKGCQLTRGTPAYKTWRYPPVPLHITFYVFNLTNANALNESATPIVEQIGPFVYKEVRNKVDIEEYQNGTISYREPRIYEFLPSLSQSDPNTTRITTMDIAYMTLVSFLQTEDIDRQISIVVRGLLDDKEKPTMQHTVHELLWGYKDPLLTSIQAIIPNLVSSNIVSAYNATVGGAGANTFTINNGADLHNEDTGRLKEVGNIEGFNGQSTVSYWTNQYANMINGTDSTIWHPDTHTDDDVYIFSADLCRSLHLTYRETYKNSFGISNYRFILPESTFNNIMNRDFCLNTTTRNQTHDIQCLHNGLMSLKTCVKINGSSVPIPLQIIASSPHFLDADPFVQTAVQGLKPDDSKHRSFMDIEAITGTVMNGSRRMQVNLNVVNDSTISFVSNYKSLAFPLLWFDEHAEIDQKSVDEFNANITTPITILNVMKYFLLATGTVLFAIVLVLLVRNRHQMNTTGSPFPDAPDETAPLCS